MFNFLLEMDPYSKCAVKPMYVFRDSCVKCDKCPQRKPNEKQALWLM